MSEVVNIIYGIDDEGLFVTVKDVRFRSYEIIIKHHPELTEPQNSQLLAELYFRFSKQQNYYIFVEDVEIYIEKLKSQVEREILAGPQPFSPFRPRLIDFGIPEYDLIHPPLIEDGRIKYCVHDRHTSVPYLVTGSLIDQKSVSVTPISLNPVEMALITPEPDANTLKADIIPHELPLPAIEIEELERTQSLYNDEADLVHDLVDIEIDALLTEYQVDNETSFDQAEDLDDLMAEIDRLLAPSDENTYSSKDEDRTDK